MMLPLHGTFLFQGDSITDAFRRPEELCDGYRLGNGYTFIIGSLLRATAGEAGLSVQNRGVSGHIASNLLGRWQRDCIELRPDVLSLLVGINDVVRIREHGAPALEDFIVSFDGLLEQTRAALPRCRIIVLEPFALPVATVASAMPMLVTVQDHIHAAAERIQATFVPLQQAFEAAAGDHPERWLYDGIHPTAAGHWLIAQRWLELVAGISLPAPVVMDVGP